MAVHPVLILPDIFLSLGSIISTNWIISVLLFYPYWLHLLLFYHSLINTVIQSVDISVQLNSASGATWSLSSLSAADELSWGMWSFSDFQKDSERKENVMVLACERHQIHILVKHAGLKMQGIVLLASQLQPVFMMLLIWQTVHTGRSRDIHVSIWCPWNKYTHQCAYLL